LRGVYRPEGPPWLPSLSLRESGVLAESEERDGRDIGIERTERSRTFTEKQINKYYNVGSFM